MLQKVKGQRKGDGYGMWPPPVYEAHFDDNSVVRMSFWSPWGKPYDTDRARHLFESKPCKIGSRTIHGLCHGKRLVMGFVEHDAPGEPFVRFADPHFGGTAPETQKKKRASIKDARNVIRELLARVDAASINPATLSLARELINT